MEPFDTIKLQCNWFAVIGQTLELETEVQPWKDPGGLNLRSMHRRSLAPSAGGGWELKGETQSTHPRRGRITFAAVKQETLYPITLDSQCSSRKEAASIEIDAHKL